MKNKTIWIEMLIILVVIGVLGMITFNQFSLASAKSRDADRMSSLHELSKAIRLYYKDYGKLPSENEINNLWGKEWKDDGNYTYLKLMPKENYLNKEFCYQVSSDGNSFLFFVELENKTNIDCKKDAWECGGVKYCYRDILPAEVVE
jgi:type II secretory pathway pseudopilin PulG